MCPAFVPYDEIGNNSIFFPACFRANTTFKMNVTLPTFGTTQMIPLVASSIALHGRQSKVIVTGYTFGRVSKVLYSTAQIFFAGTIDGRDVLFLYGDSTQEHEVAVFLTGTPNKSKDDVHASHPAITFSAGSSTAGLAEGATIVSVLPGVNGLVTVWDSDTQLVLFADPATTATFWAPTVAQRRSESDPLRNFWGLGTNETVLVGGPYLVRGARIDSEGVLSLEGDLKSEVGLVVVGPRNVRSVRWNGEVVSGEFGAQSGTVTGFGGFEGRLGVKRDGGGVTLRTGISVPELHGWRYRDSLPEIGRRDSGLGEYDDVGWTVADRRSTHLPSKPYYGDGRVLYGCDYGL